MLLIPYLVCHLPDGREPLLRRGALPEFAVERCVIAARDAACRPRQATLSGTVFASHHLTLPPSPKDDDAAPGSAAIFAQ